MSMSCRLLIGRPCGEIALDSYAGQDGDLARVLEPEGVIEGHEMEKQGGYHDGTGTGIHVHAQYALGVLER